MRTKRISLAFGALADPLEKQLVDQGLIFTGKTSDMKRYEKARQALIVLAVPGYISEREAQNVRGRLFKAITKSVIR